MSLLARIIRKRGTYRLGRKKEYKVEEKTEAPVHCCFRRGNGNGDALNLGFGKHSCLHSKGGAETCEKMG